MEGVRVNDDGGYDYWVDYPGGNRLGISYSVLNMVLGLEIEATLCSLNFEIHEAVVEEALVYKHNKQ